ncbi:MAG: AAA family ATPase [Silicimonas sp.]|nr:AAA family ATPase [Silicimonas sp.]NNL36021.1 AAA family ATPase [Silicimonas sp.]
MSRKRTSLLLFSDDKEISSHVQAALANVAGLKMKAEDVSVSNINGKAFDLAAQNDIVVFATDPENAADVATIRRLDDERQDNAIFLALTDSSITLASARALTDAGVDEVLPYPISNEELSRHVEKWIKKQGTRAGAAGDREGAIIPVVQARGGIGSTTVAVNLADHLLAPKSRFRKEASNRVALVDMDFQFGSVGDFLELEPQEAIFQMAAGGLIPDAMWIEQSMAETEKGLQVLTAPSDFVPLDAITERQISALIQNLRKTNDYVVVDLPRALVPWIQPVMDDADQMIIVTDTTVPAIRSAKRLIEFYKTDNPNLHVEVVINHEKKPMVQAHHHKEAARALDVRFEHWLPHDEKAARASVDFGKPLSAVAGSSGLNKAISALARSTMKALPSVEHATH